ncbi:MFS transporter [Desulfogranum mediterraneum]|uniref:MFS transporter n=1 Tax=Desulfogranum mediterraneum TaxID=160661 RepID=UPI00040CCB5B|nr:MFS transporter [Desulfogranum mediterraneum]
MTVPGKSVQDYIDEPPSWPDGTPAPSTPMTGMQWYIWALASAGKFFEGLVVFMTGVALPLMVQEFSLDALAKGTVGGMPLFGILIGAASLGNLADRYGRKMVFIVEMLLLVFALTLLVFSSSYLFLLAALFGVGLSLGGDYPAAHLIISESIPSSKRGRLVLSAFAFQALGALAGAAIGTLILMEINALAAWRWMYATAIAPAVIVALARFAVTESAPWLVSQGRIQEAERAAERLLRREPPYPGRVVLTAAPSPRNHEQASETGLLTLLSADHRRSTLLAAVPWFLQDLSTYGIGIFTPTILASELGTRAVHARNLADIIHSDLLAARGTACIDLLLLLGILLAIVLADRVGRIRLQIFGFLGCGLGLLLAALSLSCTGQPRLLLLFAGLMLFNLMTNLGPNAMTYLIAGEVFPTAIRGKGAGFAASAAKVGAVTTALLFPVLLAKWSVAAILAILITTSLLGALVTWLFRQETGGINLESVSSGEDR